MPWHSLLNLLLCSCKSIKPEWRQPPRLRQLRAQCQLFDQLRTAFCFLAPARFASTSSSTCSCRKGRTQLKPLTAVQIIHNKSAKAACCGAVHQRICLALPCLVVAVVLPPLPCVVIYDYNGTVVNVSYLKCWHVLRLCVRVCEFACQPFRVVRGLGVATNVFI